MWPALLLLFAPAFANGNPAIQPKTPTPVQAPAVDQYVRLFDRVMSRKLGRKMLVNNAMITIDDPGDFIGSAASEAAIDWSLWAMRRLPTPTLTLPSLRKAAPSPSPDAAPAIDATTAARSPQRAQTVARSHRRPSSLDLGLMPQIPVAGTDQTLDARLQATASGLGLSAWRLSSQPMAKTWSVWMRQDLVRGLSVVAAADSLPKRPELAGVSGGALVRVPGQPLRLYARYAVSPERDQTAAEHKVALTLSVAPKDTRKRKKR